MIIEIILENLNLILDIIARGATFGIVAVMVYRITRYFDVRGLRFKLANTLILEIEDIVEKIISQTPSRSLFRYGYRSSSSDPLTRSRRLPVTYDDIYKGLVNSNNISNFDLDLQKTLRVFNRHVKTNNIMINTVLSTLDAVKKVRDDNRPISHRIKRQRY